MNDRELRAHYARLQVQYRATKSAREAYRVARNAARSDPRCPSLTADHFAEWDTFLTTRGVMRLSVSWYESTERLRAKFEALRRLPATTPAGAAVKLRAFLLVWEECADRDVDGYAAIREQLPLLLASVANELEAMAPARRSRYGGAP